MARTIAARPMPPEIVKDRDIHASETTMLLATRSVNATPNARSNERDQVRRERAAGAGCGFGTCRMRPTAPGAQRSTPELSQHGEFQADGECPEFR